MESLIPSHLSRSKGKEPCLPLPSPIKPSSNAAIPSPSKASISKEIETPQKLVEHPRRSKNRSVVFSVNEVRRIAQGLQRSNKDSTDPSDLNKSGDDLLSVEASKPSRAKTPVKLPEKYELLTEFFNSMDSSIRLIRMKGSSPTFPTICASIQNLTERRFTYGHLAQLKYILPEAILIKKVLLHDEVTSCTRPELHVTLQVDAIECTVKGKGENGYSILRRVFRERLLDFSREHPEGEDIPEGELPHPFNPTKSVTLLNAAIVTPTSSRCVQSSSHTPLQHQFAVPSHMSPSFRRSFSLKVPIPDSEKTSLTCHNKQPNKEPPVSVAPSPINSNLRPPITRRSLPGRSIPLPLLSTQGTHEDAKNTTKSQNSSEEKLSILVGTPAKLVSTPARLMAATPDIQTPKRSPKRCYSSIDYESPPTKKSARRTRLFTTPTKMTSREDEDGEAKSVVVDDYNLNLLPKSLLQSIREKEKKVLEEKDAGVIEAKRRQKLLACLPSIFDVILLIYQSGERSVMTKEELIHKIVAGHSKIVDRCEVEEQLELLKELVPDWIIEKMASSGDALYRVNKTSSPEEIRQRLANAQ